MPELTPTERYAVDLILDGAESAVEDDMNEDAEVTDEEQEDANDLVYQIIHAIRTNPRALLALTQPTETE